MLYHHFHIYSVNNKLAVIFLPTTRDWRFNICVNELQYWRRAWVGCSFREGTIHLLRRVYLLHKQQGFLTVPDQERTNEPRSKERCRLSEMLKDHVCSIHYFRFSSLAYYWSLHKFFMLLYKKWEMPLHPGTGKILAIYSFNLRFLSTSKVICNWPP